jgi:hypothetical protein
MSLVHLTPPQCGLGRGTEVIMTKRIEQSRRHGRHDPRFADGVAASTTATDRPFVRALARPASPGGRYELRYGDGDYAGTFVTDVPSWHAGDTFVTGDGKSLRITGIVPAELIEVSDRPRHGVWEVQRV